MVQTSTQAVGRHPCPALSSAPAEATTLHRIVREHLETYLALANESGIAPRDGRRSCFNKFFGWCVDRAGS